MIIFHNKNEFFLPINNPNLRFLNLRFDIKNNVLWDFFYLYFNKNERKKIETPHTCFLMLKKTSIIPKPKPYHFHNISHRGCYSKIFF